MQDWHKMTDLTDQIIVITGGTGVLLRPAVESMVRLGAQVVLLSRTMDEAHFQSLSQLGKPPLFIPTDVREKSRLMTAREKTLTAFGRVDVLINGAGGNQSGATTGDSQQFFDLSEDAIENVFAVNFQGTLRACQVFGEPMAERGKGVILNVSSMAGIRPLTRVVSYSAAKAAINNLTQWLAVHMAREYGSQIRVNALAPGFLLTNQNRFLLTDERGDLTERGRQILAATPMNRFGDPEEMVGAILWLISDASQFVTGIVVPVDGGFSAFGGV